MHLIESHQLLGQLPTQLPKHWSAFTPDRDFGGKPILRLRFLHYFIFSAPPANLFYRYWRRFIGDALDLAVAPVGVANWGVTSRRSAGQNHGNAGDAIKKFGRPSWYTRRFGAQRAMRLDDDEVSGQSASHNSC